MNEYTVYTEKNKFRDYRQNTVEYDTTKPQAIKGRYCFVCGPITVMDPVCDAEFGVFTDQPYLERKVETYQWQEISKQIQDRTEITYKSVWSEQILSSDGFKNKNYRNSHAPYKKEIFSSQ